MIPQSWTNNVLSFEARNADLLLSELGILAGLFFIVEPFCGSGSFIIASETFTNDLQNVYIFIYKISVLFYIPQIFSYKKYIH